MGLSPQNQVLVERATNPIRLRWWMNHSGHVTELNDLLDAARADDGEQSPSEPGGFVGDIFFGDPRNSTRGTHRWRGSALGWERLPSDVEVLTDLLAEARRERDEARAELAKHGVVFARNPTTGATSTIAVARDA